MSHSAHAAIPVHPSDYACIDFINSAFTDYLGEGAGEDRLGSPQWRRWFLERHGLAPTVRATPPMSELVALRRHLRRILEKWSRGDALTSRDVHVLDTRIRAAPLRQRVTSSPDGIALVEQPLEKDWAWIIASIVASSVELMLTGDPRRLKSCKNPNCSWMFYDDTVNRSQLFCSPTPCALLIRVRRFRERA